ncbi:MAG TPA: MauE/DoxX family redox-associated membrane protein [Candidatus Binatia bacterium]|jgi:hypothetical protein|nr:MauE/DoxX family redox-associated membrane protein [Candidatus Binatia bacterium]
MDPTLHLTLRIALALLLAAAAAHKLRDRAAFQATLAAYQLIPASLAPVVIGIELGVAVALCVPTFGNTGVLAAAALLLLYAIAIGVNLVRGRDIDCGCAGPAARRPIGGGLVVRNVVLAVAALLGLAPLQPRPLVWMDAVTVVAAVLALSALYGAADHLLALAPTAARLRRAAA